VQHLDGKNLYNIIHCFLKRKLRYLWFIPSCQSSTGARYFLDLSVQCNEAEQEKKNTVLCPERALLPTSVFKNALVTHSPTARNAFVLPLFLNLCFVLLLLVLLLHVSVAIFGGEIN